MFTGLIEEVGAVARRQGATLGILADAVRMGLSIGDSISVNGACLTVSHLDEKGFSVQVSPETYARTALGRLQPGHPVNLERAMPGNGRFGGHFVLGHVDGVGKVEAVQEQGQFSLWRFRAPAEVARYLVPKGSIAIDGISLTVVEPAGDTFCVAIIPTTLAKTALGMRRPGDPVNMEADVIAKHIWHFMNQNPQRGDVSHEFLARHGFA
jgi:riboflavin synthase